MTIREFEAMIDPEATVPAALSDEQLAYFEDVLAEHTDAEWTVVCMHMPAWQSDGSPALDRLRHALDTRPYTMFAGHVHNYRREVIDGRDHVRLGPSGAAWVKSGDEGNFDHVSLVHVGPDGLRVTNVLLDGVLGVEGGAHPRGRID